MNPDADNALQAKIREQLDRHAGSVDELAAARLATARRQALASRRSPARYWVPLSGIAAAAAVLLAVVVVHHAPRPDGDWDPLMATEDIDLIEDMDFYAWLDETQSKS